MGAMTALVGSMSGPGSRAIRYTIGLVLIIGGVVQGSTGWLTALVGYVLMHLAATDTCILRRLIGQPATKRDAPASCFLDRGQVFDL
ncbi:DUF2892 domain-containing protein [Skermania sp. ID1734]|nr:DUF2892 domain-containing protein [Skermania sp. ID1734]